MESIKLLSPAVNGRTIPNAAGSHPFYVRAPYLSAIQQGDREPSPVPLLKNKDFDLPQDVLQRLTELTPKGVPVEASVMLYKYYAANKEDDQVYVVLPQQNFNAYFGSTAFSQKWTAALTGKVIEKKYSEGVCKYKIQ